MEKSLLNTKNYDNDPHIEIIIQYRSLLKKHETELIKKWIDYQYNVESKTGDILKPQIKWNYNSHFNS